MEQFAYSFIVTMLHSIWQMALLLLLYYAATNLPGKWHPLAKRNLMLILLGTQLLLSVSSFYLVYSAPFFDYRESVQQILQTLGSSQHWMQAYSTWIFSAYAVALLYKIAATMMNWARFRKIYGGELIKASADIRSFTSEHAFQFGIKRKVQIWYSNHIQSPIVFGFLKPMILLPVAMINRLSVCQTEALIIHELTHIKYKDYLYNWMLLTAEAIYFFNPFVKIAVRHIKKEREKNCDLQVLQFSYSPVGYAEALLMIARQQVQAVQVPVAAVAKSNELFNRIRYFSAANNNKDYHHSRSIPFVTIMLMGLMAINIFFAGLHISKTPEKYTTIKLNPSIIPTAAVTKELGPTIYTEAIEDVAAADLLNAMAMKKSALAQKASAEKEAITAKATAPALAQQQAEEEENYDLEAGIHPLATAVALPADAPLQVKDIMVNEESSNGTSTTRVYRFTQSVNGEWTVVPLIMVTEQTLTDSLKNIIRKDSSIIQIIPTIQ